MDLPLALLESLSGGVPALVADVGPLADLVRCGAAQGVDPQNPSAIANAAVKLLTDKAAHQRAALRARRFSQEEGSVARLVTAHEALYDELLGE